MKKLLVVCLGLLVFAACSDDGGNGGSAGNGNVDVITEKLTTSLVEISMISSNDLGSVFNNSQFDVKFTVKNLSTTDQMQLKLTDTRNPDLTSGIGLDNGTCTKSIIDNTYSQPAGSSCEFTQPLIITTTTEGSPFVLYFEDANGDKLAVVIKYTIDQTPITEQLETSLIKIDVPVKNLGAVADGSQHIFKFTITNKSNEPMKLYSPRAGQGAEFNQGLNIGSCTDVKETPESPFVLYITQDAGASCEFAYNLTIVATNAGSPYEVIFEDANRELLTVVLNYSIE